MTPATPPPSSRLLRAADAERAELDRHRDRLHAAREELRAELARVEAGLADVDERRRLLDRLAPTPTAGPGPDEADGDGVDPAVSLHPELTAVVDQRRALRGPAIRETAVELLLSRPDGIEALHYREWFDLVTAEGYAIVGKDPLAVFLTQISRSPVVRRSTQAGVYEIDRDASGALRRELDDLHEQLRETTAAPAPSAGLSETRARRQTLMADISRVEKALEEARRLLEVRPVGDLAGVG
jgi:hypothetical protein